MDPFAPVKESPLVVPHYEVGLRDIKYLFEARIRVRSVSNTISQKEKGAGGFLPVEVEYSIQRSLVTMDVRAYEEFHLLRTSPANLSRTPLTNLPASFELKRWAISIASLMMTLIGVSGQ